LSETSSQSHPRLALGEDHLEVHHHQEMIFPVAHEAGAEVEAKAEEAQDITKTDHQDRTRTEEARLQPPLRLPTAEPEPAALEEDGWSTVSKPKKNNRGGNAGARAIAS
jgi:hypothetical protein